MVTNVSEAIAVRPPKKGPRLAQRMNPPSMESIFLLLSGVILLAGVLYWFWSHIQLTQKKVQLLENAVFELRTMMSGREVSGPPNASGPAVAVSGTSPYRDLDDDDWSEEKVITTPDSTPILSGGSPLPAPVKEEKENRSLEVIMEERESALAQPDIEEQTVNADLQPGGRILVPSEAELVSAEGPVEETAQFKNLFVAPIVSNVAPTTEALEGMPVKELRRLAEQRGIAGAETMKKKEILAALKAQIQPATAPATLDLHEMTISDESEVAVEKVEELAEAVPVME